MSSNIIWATIDTANRDLAARNVLVNNDMVAKLADLGLSRKLDMSEEAYLKVGCDHKECFLTHLLRPAILEFPFAVSGIACCFVSQLTSIRDGPRMHS